MVFLASRTNKGHRYWSIVESVRVDGEPKQRILAYLGTASNILDLAQGKRNLIFESVQPREFGLTAALYQEANDLGLVGLLNQHLPKRDQGATPGDLLLAGAINRVVRPKSKDAFEEWSPSSVLPRLLPEAAAALNSQSFWNHFHDFTAQQEAAVWNLIAPTLAQRGVPVDRVLYDPTNFYTYFEAPRNTLAKHGKNKKKRSDLLQVCAWLACNVEGVPLNVGVYAGNVHDATEFSESAKRVMTLFDECGLEVESFTLVMDKGNNSGPNLKLFPEKWHVLGSLKRSQARDLFEVPLEHFEKLSTGTLAYRLQRQVWHRVFTLVVTYDEELRVRNAAEFQDLVTKGFRKLEELRGKNLTRAEFLAEAKLALQHYKIAHLVTLQFHGEKPSWSLDGAAVKKHEAAFGKTVMFTDNHEWKTEDIVAGYRCKDVVERCFHLWNSPWVIPVQPIRHFVDGTIRAHVLMCGLSLLLVSLVMRKVRAAGIVVSEERLLEWLRGIQEVTLRVKGAGEFVQLSDLGSDQRKVYELLGLKRWRAA